MITLVWYRMLLSICWRQRVGGWVLVVVVCGVGWGGVGWGGWGRASKATTPPPHTQSRDAAPRALASPSRAHLRAPLHRVLGPHVAAEEGADDEVDGHWGKGRWWEEAGGRQGRRQEEAAAGGDVTRHKRWLAGIVCGCSAAPCRVPPSYHPGLPPPTATHPPTCGPQVLEQEVLDHAKAPLLAQHLRLVEQRIAQRGAQQLPLARNATVEGHALRIAAQAGLRG